MREDKSIEVMDNGRMKSPVILESDSNATSERLFASKKQYSGIVSIDEGMQIE
jgi:hypothetical protein